MGKAFVVTSSLSDFMMRLSMIAAVLTATFVVGASQQVQDLGDGLTLTELKPGNGNDFPKTGDKLTMHYTGTLSDGGDKFDSSRDRNMPFHFTIGVGQVINGWDLGVKHMSLGERAILHVPSSLGYGE